MFFTIAAQNALEEGLEVFFWYLLIYAHLCLAWAKLSFARTRPFPGSGALGDQKGIPMEVFGEALGCFFPMFMMMAFLVFAYVF